MKNPIFLSLDLSTWDEAHELSQLLKNEVGGFKIGPRLAVKANPKDWQKISDCGPVFFDPKYYDIPNTMVESIKASVDLGVSYITVHASSGVQALTQVKKLEDEINRSHFFKVLAVTALTSFGPENLMPGYKNQTNESIVFELAELTISSGLTGIVCSGQEVKKISKLSNDLFTVVPGIRLSGSANDDQSRVMTPDLALSLGAKALVIGRPIINAQDPLKAVRQFNDLCKG